MQIETVAARRSIFGIELFAVHSAPEPLVRRRRPGRGWAVRVGLGATALLLVAAAADLLSKSASARSVEPPAAEAVKTPSLAARTDERPVWIEVNRPIQLFELAGPAFSRLTLTYRARRRTDGAERQDLLAYGSFGGETPYVSLSVLRTGTDPEPATFFVAMARLAADHDLAVVRSGNPAMMATRFGAFAAADLTLQRDGTAQACLGFRLQSSGEAAAPVEISGFACGTATKPMDRDVLACLLDRVDLVSAGEDARLQRFFVDAERRRGQGCKSQRLLAAGSRNTWLDGEVLMPPLRHLSGGAGPLR